MSQLQPSEPAPRTMRALTWGQKRELEKWYESKIESGRATLTDVTAARDASMELGFQVSPASLMSLRGLMGVAAANGSTGGRRKAGKLQQRIVRIEQFLLAKLGFDADARSEGQGDLF